LFERSDKNSLFQALLSWCGQTAMLFS